MEQLRTSIRKTGVRIRRYKEDEMGQEKPNCIVLAADQLRYDVLGTGYTPNIDALMEDSVRFSNAYCASPLCVPARGALFTGTHPGVNGSLINGWLKSEAGYSKVKEGMDHLYGVMERLDMDCIHSGKQHLFVEGEPLQLQQDTKTKWVTTEQSYREFLKEHGKRAPGGPEFRTPVPELTDGVHTRICNYSNPHTGVYEEGLDYYFDGYFTNGVMEALKAYDGAKPLFLSMMHLAPHPPFDIPEPWYSMVKTEDVELPDNVNQWYPHQSPLQKYNLTGMIGNSYHLEDWKEAWRAYLGLVGLLDDCVGRVINELKRRNLYENSVIVFTSDHGEMLGSHCLFQKMCMYEESVKAPLSIRLPGGRRKGVVVEDCVSHIDVLPTICELFNTTVKHEMNGRSLVPLLEGEKAQQKYPAFIQYDGNASRGNFQRCIIWKKHKLIVDIFKDETFFELYDLERDCQEKVNLLFEEGYLELEGELEFLLREHQRKMKDAVSFPAFDGVSFLKHYGG